ncbi:MAG: AraC family transcriptional regulator ligand-binding domain-containing protein [Hyphomicrobiaceae bacterium]
MTGLDVFLDRDYGIALEDLLIAVKIDERPPWEDGTRIEMAKFACLLELAAERSREDCFGLLFADEYPPKAGGVLGFLIASAPDLRTFMNCLCRYARLQIGALNMDYVEKDGLLRITWDYDPAFAGPRKQLTEFLMCLFVRRTLQLFGDDLKPVTAEFEYREPDCLDKYRERFGQSLRFSCETNTLVTRAEILARRSHSSDDRLYRLMRKIADDELERTTQQSDIVAQVDKLIIGRLAHSEIDLDVVARELELSTRQLQSQLKRRNTSFEAELTKVRSQLADRYLRETDLAMTEIALMLGFSELSSFTRAARGWFNMPPSAYRVQARMGKSA